MGQHIGHRLKMRPVETENVDGRKGRHCSNSAGQPLNLSPIEYIDLLVVLLNVVSVLLLQSLWF